MQIRSWMVPGNVRANMQQHKSKEPIRIQPDPISQEIGREYQSLKIGTGQAIFLTQ